MTGDARTTLLVAALLLGAPLLPAGAQDAIEDDISENDTGEDDIGDDEVSVDGSVRAGWRLLTGRGRGIDSGHGGQNRSETPYVGGWRADRSGNDGGGV